MCILGVYRVVTCRIAKKCLIDEYHVVDVHVLVCLLSDGGMGWLRLVGSLKLWVSFAKEPYERSTILHKRRIILRSLLIVATP